MPVSDNNYYDITCTRSLYRYIEIYGHSPQGFSVPVYNVSVGDFTDCSEQFELLEIVIMWFCILFFVIVLNPAHGKHSNYFN